MARTLLAGEFDLAAGRATDVYVKLEVQNGSGTWKNVATVIGGECTINVQQGEHIDTKVGQATFTLIQKLGNVSLAPLIEASAANVDDTAAYSPLLDVGRLIRCYTATMGDGVTLDTGKYREIFTGRIDDVILNDQVSAWAGPIQLQCSDLGGWLMDLQIETPDVQYGTSPVGTNLETVLQAVIDDNLPAGDPAVTVVKTSTSNFAVTDYKQGETKVMEGLTTLVLDSVGEDIRYRYDASHVSTLQWIDPDRSRATIDGTFTSRQYLLRRLSLSLANIRNAGAMPFTDVASGVTGVVEAESLSSIDKFRRRFFRIPGSTMLTTRAESQAVINRVVNDLEAPPAEAEAELAYCWFVQLYDRYTFSANSRQYDQDQTFSVVAYQHTIEANRANTTLTLTARVVGAYKEWLKRIRVGGTVFQTAAITHVTSEDSFTERTFTLTIGSRVDTVHVHYRTVPVDVTGDPFDFSGNETVTEEVTTVILPRTANLETVSIAVPLPAAGYRVCGRAIPYTVGLPDPVEGASWLFKIEPAALDAPAQGTVSISSNGTWEATADGPVNALSFRWSSSTSAYPADATVQASGTLVSGTGRFLAISGGAALTFGDTVYITVVPFDSTGGLGSALPAIHLRGSYQSFTATKSVYFGVGSFVEFTNPKIGFKLTNGALVPLSTGGTNPTTFGCIVVLPDGATGTDFYCDVICANPGTEPGSVTVTLSRVATDGSLTTVGTDGGFSFSGTTSYHATFSESTTSRRYLFKITWSEVVTTNNWSFVGFYIVYTTPNPKVSV